MAKRLVDIDDEALDRARSQLGTRTIKDTVNQALKLAGGDRVARVRNAIESLSEMEIEDRASAWR